jgi:ATP-binding cassette, subfamily B, bacterial
MKDSMPTPSLFPGAIETRGLPERFRTLKNVGPFLILLWETGPLLVVAYFSARLLRATLPVAILYITKLVVDTVVHGSRAGTVDTRRLWQLILIELFLAILSDVITRCVTVADSLISDRVVNSASEKLIRHASKLDLPQFEEADYQNRLERAQQVVRRMQLTTQLMSAAQDVLMLAIFATAILVLLPWLLVILVVSSLPVFLAEGHFASLSYALLYRRTEQRRELDYVRSLGLTQEAAKEVKVFGLGENLVSRYQKLANLFAEENLRLLLRRARVGAIFTIIGTVGYYGAYGLVIYQTLQGKLSIGDLAFLVASFARSRSLIDGLVTNVSAITEQAMYLDYFYAFLRMEPVIRSKHGALPVPDRIKEGLEFRNVTFRYQGANRDALNNVSFRLEPNKPIGLIGVNGAGKTTVTRLLARLYDPTEGQILLDGIDLREYDLESWRRQIGIIFQDFVHYDMLASENIGFGCLPRSQDRGHIERSAKLSTAYEVVSKFNKGIDQMLGKRFDGGVELSIGEWQKIALARAYMSDSQVLVLDEPTAAHDARSEHHVHQQLRELVQGKLTLLISHRLPNVRLAHRILVLSAGQVFEEGTHQELLTSKGLYAELFELQAAGYK